MSLYYNNFDKEGPGGANVYIRRNIATRFNYYILEDSLIELTKTDRPFRNRLPRLALLASCVKIVTSFILPTFQATIDACFLISLPFPYTFLASIGVILGLCTRGGCGEYS